MYNPIRKPLCHPPCQVTWVATCLSSCLQDFWVFQALVPNADVVWCVVQHRWATKQKNSYILFSSFVLVNRDSYNVLWNNHRKIGYGLIPIPLYTLNSQVVFAHMLLLAEFLKDIFPSRYPSSHLDQSTSFFWHKHEWGVIKQEVHTSMLYPSWVTSNISLQKRTDID